MKQERRTIFGIDTLVRCYEGTTPVVIVHGWGSRGANWSKVAQGLSEQGYAVYQPDLPGFGDSAVPDRGWTIEDYALFLEAFLIEYALEKPLLVVHSHGGRMLLKLHGLGKTGLFQAHVMIGAAGIQHALGAKQKTVQALSKTAKPLFTLWPFSKLRPFIEKVLKRIIGSGDYHKTSGVMRETFLNVKNEDLSAYIPRVSAPTLLLWGVGDSMTPVEDGERMFAEMPHAKLKTFKGIGHNLHQEMPEKLVTEICTFFKSLDTK